MFGQKNSLAIFLMSLILTLLIGCLNVAPNSGDSSLSIPSKEEKDTTSQTDNAPSLSIPINCHLGKDCFIMHYVDLDPTEAAVDFSCGRQTYDGHKGTDFGIANLQVMARDVPVLAAASGLVLRTRDGIPDRLINDLNEKQLVAEKECGNGVVIDHGNGWETQYCHLRQGSIAVKPNTKVEQGTVLGMVGASGLTSFPHLHLSVRQNGVIIDPFVGTKATKNCNQNLNPLWSQPLNYVPTGSIDGGFASKPPTQTELWSGKYKDNQLAADIPALIFWVHTYGVLQGDVQKWQLIAPDGTVAIEQENTLDRSFRSWLGYVGKRNIVPGLWQGEYQLWRGSSLLFKVNREVVVGD